MIVSLALWLAAACLGAWRAEALVEALQGTPTPREARAYFAADKVRHCAKCNEVLIKRQQGQIGTHKPPDSIRAGSAFAIQAATEEGIDPKSVSLFGQLIPKFPRSFVEAIVAAAKNATKIYRYNFQGSATGIGGRKGKYKDKLQPRFVSHRKWVLEFAAENFTDKDLLVIKDHGDDWEPLGAFDKSLEASGKYFYHGYRGTDTYFDVMAASNFTLCPSGDARYSKRYYEAALVGSIPVILSAEEDNNWVGMCWAPFTQAVSNRYKRVILRDLPAAYEPSWAEENLRTFIRYHTFMEGDHTPPELEACVCEEDGVEYEWFRNPPVM